MTPEQFEKHMAVQEAILEELKAARRLLTAPLYVANVSWDSQAQFLALIGDRERVASGEFESP